MALGGRILGGAMLAGAAVLALGAVVAAPRLLKAARPALREGLKRGMRFYEAAREGAAAFAEDVEDLVAEVRAEMTAAPPGEHASEPAVEQPTDDESSLAR